MFYIPCFLFPWMFQRKKYSLFTQEEKLPPIQLKVFLNVSLATGFALLQLRTRHSWKVHYEIVILMMSLFCVCLKSYKDKTSDNIIPSENSLKEFLSSTHTSKRMNLSLPKGLVLPSNIIFVPRVVSDSQSLTASSKFSNCTFFSVSKQKIFANL